VYDCHAQSLTSRTACMLMCWKKRTTIVAYACFLFHNLKGKASRKKLYRPSCNDERPKLSEFFAKIGYASLFDTIAQNAVICYGCHQNLKKIVNIEKKLQQREEEVTNLLKNFRTCKVA